MDTGINPLASTHPILPSPIWCLQLQSGFCYLSSTLTIHPKSFTIHMVPFIAYSVAPTMNPIIATTQSVHPSIQWLHCLSNVLTIHPALLTVHLFSALQSHIHPGFPTIYPMPSTSCSTPSPIRVHVSSLMLIVFLAETLHLPSALLVKMGLQREVVKFHNLYFSIPSKCPIAPQTQRCNCQRCLLSMIPANTLAVTTMVKLLTSSTPLSLQTSHICSLRWVYEFVSRSPDLRNKPKSS